MEPQSAIDYEERGASAVIAVLLEIGQVLGAFRERFVIIGGAVPWLLLPNARPAHIGTLDVDLSLDPSALGDAEYVGLVEALEASGYERGEKFGLRPFQLRRLVPAADGEHIPVIVDLLMPRESQFTRNKPPILANFAVLKADGATIAMQRVAPAGRFYARWTQESRRTAGRQHCIISCHEGLCTGGS